MFFITVVLKDIGFLFNFLIAAFNFLTLLLFNWNLLTGVLLDLTFFLLELYLSLNLGLFPFSIQLCLQNFSLLLLSLLFKFFCLKLNSELLFLLLLLLIHGIFKLLIEAFEDLLHVINLRSFFFDVSHFPWGSLLNSFPSQPIQIGQFLPRLLIDFIRHHPLVYRFEVLLIVGHALIDSLLLLLLLLLLFSDFYQLQSIVHLNLVV